MSPIQKLMDWRDYLLLSAQLQLAISAALFVTVAAHVSPGGRPIPGELRRMWEAFEQCDVDPADAHAGFAVLIKQVALGWGLLYLAPGVDIPVGGLLTDAMESVIHPAAHTDAMETIERQRQQP